MKHIITIITMLVLLLVTPVTINAQITENWFVEQTEGDELLGSETIYVYLTNDGEAIMYYSSRPNMIVVSTGNGIFDFKKGRYSYLDNESIIIGYYDTDGSLIDKEEDTLFKLGYSIGHTGTKKLLNYMRTKEGYVRLVARRYNREKFDVKIPTWITNKPSILDELF